MMEESKESELLRILVAYVHVMTLNALAMSMYAKPMKALTEVERTQLQSEMLTAVRFIAEELKKRNPIDPHEPISDRPQ